MVTHTDDGERSGLVTDALLTLVAHRPQYRRGATLPGGELVRT
jgi:hypothetical protein